MLPRYLPFVDISVSTTAAKIPRMIVTITSSINVKPFDVFFNMFFILLFPFWTMSDYGTKVLCSLDGFSVSITTRTGACAEVPLPLPGIIR